MRWAIIALLLLGGFALVCWFYWATSRIYSLTRRVDENEGRRKATLDFFKSAVEDKSLPRSTPRPNIPRPPPIA